MPTAADALVTIRWTRMEVSWNEEDDEYNVLASVRVNVNGQLVDSFTQFNYTTEEDIATALATALNSKRSQYVTV